MKRILFFALLISCISFANAQVLTVSYNGEEVTENDTLTLKAGNNNEIQFEPIFHNNEMFNLVCIVRGEKLNQTTAEIVSICTIVCKDGYVSVPFPFSGNSTYGDTKVDFEVPEDAAPGLFKITIYDTADTETNASFYVKVYNKNAGVEEAVASARVKVWPNPASEEVNVEYSQSNHEGSIRLYDMSGRMVKEVATSGTEGRVRIELQGLPKGVYMLSTNDKESGVKKIVVR